MTTPTVDTVAPKTFLEAEQILASQMTGYQSRPPQQALAAAIEQVIAESRPIIRPGAAAPIEVPPKHGLFQAGTGTGKSIAVLLTAILSGERVIVSTSTIALMNQYIRKDLPLLEKLLPVKFTWAQLKGLSNYLCKAKLAGASQAQVENLIDLTAELDADENHTGDRDEITTPIAPGEWSDLSSTTAECPGRTSCPFGDVCFGYAARDKAAAAQVVVTNAKMAMLDLALTIRSRKEAEATGGTPMANPILGPHKMQIFDEGHELSDIAAETLGFEVKQGGLLHLAEQAVSFISMHAGGEDDDNYASRLGATQTVERAEKAAANLTHALEEIARAVDDHIKDTEGKNPSLNIAFFEANMDTFESIANEIGRLRAMLNATKIAHGSQETQEARKKSLLAEADNFLYELTQVLFAPEGGDMVVWPERYEVFTKGGTTKVTRWMIKACPIEVGPILAEHLWANVPAVVLSATLTSGNGDFGYMQRTLGLPAAHTLDVGTPFDYERQALLYTPPSSTPEPSAKDKDQRAAWQTWCQEMTYELVRKAGGGAMLLFTSREDMKAAHKALAPRLQAAGLPVYMQGLDYTNAEIVERFKAEEDSVLFGLKSFMVGVDFPGKTNRLVIISKIPFPRMNDPIFAAREAKMKARGGDPFNELSIPMALLTLLQAYGRLIRTLTDWGTVAILDPRLNSSRYGKRILAALPDSINVHDLAAVATWYDGWNEALAA